MPTQIQIPGWDVQAQNDELFNLRQIRIFDFNLSDMMSFTVGFAHTLAVLQLQASILLTPLRSLFYFDIFPAPQSGNISLFETQRIFIDRKKKKREEKPKNILSQIFYICLIYQSVFILALSK